MRGVEPSFSAIMTKEASQGAPNRQTLMDSDDVQTYYSNGCRDNCYYHINPTKELESNPIRNGGSRGKVIHCTRKL